MEPLLAAIGVTRVARSPSVLELESALLELMRVRAGSIWVIDDAHWLDAESERLAGRVARHVWDLVRHGRSQRLVNGHALAGALLLSAADRGVRLDEAQQLIDKAL